MSDEVVQPVAVAPEISAPEAPTPPEIPNPVSIAQDTENPPEAPVPPRNKGGRPRKIRKPGRPTVFTPAVMEKLRMAYLIGATDAEACAYAGIGAASIYNYQKDKPDFLEKKEGWKNQPILKAKKTVVDALGEVQNAQWYLERKRKDEFSVRKELTGDDGKPINVLLDELGTDYDELGSQASKQMVETNPPVQDKG